MKKISLIIGCITIITVGLFAFIPHKKHDQFKDDFDAFGVAADNYSTVLKTSGDTLSAYNALIAAYNTINTYDLSSEMTREKMEARWPTPLQFCVAGCLYQLNNCIEDALNSPSGPYNTSICDLHYESCLTHCH